MKDKKLPQFKLAKEGIITGITFDLNSDSIKISENQEAYDKLTQGPVEFIVMDKDGNYKKL